MCCLFEKTENKQKEARVGPFLKKEKEKKITELFFYSFYSDHLLLLLLSFDETEKEFQKNFFFSFFVFLVNNNSRLELNISNVAGLARPDDRLKSSPIFQILPKK